MQLSNKFATRNHKEELGTIAKAIAPVMSESDSRTDSCWVINPHELWGVFTFRNIIYKF